MSRVGPGNPDSTRSGSGNISRWKSPDEKKVHGRLILRLRLTTPSSRPTAGVQQQKIPRICRVPNENFLSS